MSGFESRRGLMSLSAKRRLIGSICSAIHTAHASFADTLQKFVVADALRSVPLRDGGYFHLKHRAAVLQNRRHRYLCREGVRNRG